MQWNAKLKRTVSSIMNLVSGVALLGWFQINNLLPLPTGISLTVIVGGYQIYNAYMVYRNEY